MLVSSVSRYEIDVPCVVIARRRSAATSSRCGMSMLITCFTPDSRVIPPCPGDMLSMREPQRDETDWANEDNPADEGLGTYGN